MLVRSEKEIYIIAEIGQNHNGDINIAKKIINQLEI
jgi:sialic acid synthase SpsE